MAEQSVSAILNGLNDAVFLISEDRQVVLCNPAAEALFGKELAGRDFVRAVRHPDCLKVIEQILNGTRKTQTTVTLEAPVPTVYTVTAVRLEEETTFAARVMVSFNDISHIRDAEQMRSDFVANVSHELRSPLTAISGFIETLRGPARDDPDAQDRFLEMMEREASRMNRLIADLLSLSRVEVNERVRPSDLADIGDIISRVITNLGSTAKEGRKTIRLNRPQQMEPIPGDDDELLQVFQNLVENAIKYGAPDTEVTISIESLLRVPGIKGEALAVSVTDSGPGIRLEHIPRLTERFYRVDEGRSRDVGGTGLGLAIVKHILNRHRGRLQIKSEPGDGSIFTVLLPKTREPR
ncbi:MAG: ATP-binding protein [Pseudomonadota bacterium]